MSLLKPTPGEVMDRIAIVKLKISAYHKAGRDSLALYRESRELTRHLEKFPVFASDSKLSRKLSETHRKLWKAENDVRIPNANMWQIADAAQRISRLNDTRCQLIRQIDQNYGVETIEEKIYG